MTTWMFAGISFGLAAYAVAWIWGGRPERFGAGVLLYSCMLSSVVYRWEVGGVHLASMILDLVRFLTFGWLCLRSNRWWPFVTTASLGLMMLVYVFELAIPAFSHRDVASAHVGLGYLVDLSLMLSVFERMQAGEAPAGPAAWASADIATTARRKRADEASIGSRPRLLLERTRRSSLRMFAALAASISSSLRGAEKG